MHYCDICRWIVIDCGCMSLKVQTYIMPVFWSYLILLSPMWERGGVMWGPCRKCVNRCKQSRKDMHFHLLKYVILSNYHVWVYQGELEHDEGIIMCGRWAARVRCPLDKGSCRNCRGIFKECGILHTGKNCGKTLYCTSQFLTNVCNSKCSEHFHLSHTQLWCCQSFKNKILKMKLTR